MEAIAEYAAFSFYFGYLKNLLTPEYWEQVVKQDVSLVSSKLHILIPLDCNVENRGYYKDVAITKPMPMQEIKMMVAGLERTYRLNKQEAPHGYIMAEYAIPLRTIKMMAAHENGSGIQEADLPQAAIAFARCLTDLVIKDLGEEFAKSVLVPLVFNGEFPPLPNEK